MVGGLALYRCGRLTGGILSYPRHTPGHLPAFGSTDNDFISTTVQAHVDVRSVGELSLCAC